MVSIFKMETMLRLGRDWDMEKNNVEISLHALERFRQRFCPTLKGFELATEFIREWENAVYAEHKQGMELFTFHDVTFVVRNGVVVTAINNF